MEPPPRQKIPKDGPGPRGLPDCYYTSRVLNSTFRYARFVRRLRAAEAEQRRGEGIALRELKDKQTSDFFIRCDRRSLINDVASRVELCMESYQRDLDEKRKKLIAMYSLEEEANIRSFVAQAQAGAEAAWAGKLERLDYLLRKREKEHAEKYKDTPLSKCAHIEPCLVKLRAKEAQEIQLYQMREKDARKKSQKEMDDMWHGVVMKESEALAARMEQDAIERCRRDTECTQYSDQQLEMKRRRRQQDRETLRQETLAMKAKLEDDEAKEAEAERQRQQKRKQTAEERRQMIEERQQRVAKQEAEAKLISDTWASLAGQGLAEEQAKRDLMRRKEKELDICNGRMVELKASVAQRERRYEPLFAAEAERRQDLIDKTRCDYLMWAQKTNSDVRKAMVDQIKDRQASREVLKQKLLEQDEYQRQLSSQSDRLVDCKDKSDAAARKQYQRDLLDQIEYNKLLKERARQEELDQIKKYKIATDQYQQEIGKMLSRPFFSEQVHPFMKQMAAGVEMREKCPCSKPDYCK